MAAELIVMLTSNDYTIANAAEIFDICKDTDAKFWGMKEKGLPQPQMKQLYDTLHRHGKTGVLEVVAYTEEEGLHGAQLAAQCGCDILLGTLYFDSIRDFCEAHNIKYMPFVGRVSGRPSVLDGEIQDMILQTLDYLEKGVYGIDLLSYRYRGDAVLLSRELVCKTGAPICMAGSITSFAQLDAIREIGPAFFTIGGAFWSHQFGEDLPTQINTVCRYMQ